LVSLFQHVEAFTKEAEGAVSDLEKLRQRITRLSAGMRLSGAEEALRVSREAFDTTKDLAHKVLQAGLSPLSQLLRSQSLIGRSVESHGTRLCKYVCTD
jgi:hypothetical protein